VKYSENRAFCDETATAAGYNRSLFQSLTSQIRYLADQWKINGIFSPINEFSGANNRITMECVCAVKKLNLVACQRSIPRRPHPIMKRQIPGVDRCVIGCLRRRRSRPLSTEKIAQIAAQGRVGGRRGSPLVQISFFAPVYNPALRPIWFCQRCGSVR
jgi:hypothetical protein